MAHEITTRKSGQAEVFVAGEPAWHKLGVNVEKAQTWKEAVRLAGLDWKVDKEELQTADGRPAPGIFGLYRNDNKRFLGRAGDDYEIIQNEKVFDWVDSIIQVEGGAHYVSAGSLFGGSTMWCLAELPEKIRIKGTDDITNNYLLFTDYRRVGKSAMVKHVQTRVVCWNTLSASLREEGKFLRISHRELDQQLDRAKQALKLAQDQTKDINQVMNLLAKTQIKSSVMKSVIEEIFPKIETSAVQQNKARDILDLFMDNDRNAFPSEAGSAYAFVNSVTRYVDHKAGARPADENEPEDKARARAALFGAGEALKFALMTSLMGNLIKQQGLSVSEKELQAVGIN